MNADEAALQAAAKTLQLATAAGESSSSLEAALAAMQRGKPWIWCKSLVYMSWGGRPGFGRRRAQLH